jgi:FKBP12-rapamycin complex-associated protein
MADENYDSLPLLHKVEVFNYALDNTTGQDLYRILWLRSRNSEAWLERRVTYTRSLGVNSMVGYILGLGDRHPSNLLLDQITGKVVHIDFGDCFEVAQQRDKYPEKVPFRLTRMLIHAMEVCGISGTFSKSCEVSMEVARNNRESLMAVLEAFVYDPLIAWRLTAGATKQPGGRVDDEMDEQGGRTRKNKASETEILGTGSNKNEVKNDKALEVVDRVRRKLTGMSFLVHASTIHADNQDVISRVTKSSASNFKLKSWWKKLQRLKIYA